MLINITPKNHRVSGVYHKAQLAKEMGINVNTMTKLNQLAMTEIPYYAECCRKVNGRLSYNLPLSEYQKSVILRLWEIVQENLHNYDRAIETIRQEKDVLNDGYYRYKPK